MYSTLVLVGLAALSAGLAPARVIAPVQAVAVEGMAAIHSKLQHAIDDDRYDDALVFAKALTVHPDFVGLPREGQATIHYLVGVLHLQAGRPAAALPSLTLATESPGATLAQWMMRLDASSAARDRDGTARILAVMLARFPEAKDELFDDFVLQMAGSPEVDREAAFELRLALLRSGWSHDEDSWIWVKLVDDLIARERGAEAEPVIARVTAAPNRLQLFAMRRYDAVRPADATFDVATAYAADLELDRTRAEAPGATIEDRNAYVMALRARGRFDEALVLADPIVAAPLPDAELEPEAASHLTWAMDTRAHILVALGRHDEAVEQARAAALRTEYGQPNVSQTINLGGILLRLERYSEARDVVAGIEAGQVSAYGLMQALQVRACAAHSLSDDATATALFARLDAGWRDAPTATYAALACRGDEDGMARLLVEMLADPEHQEIGVAYMHRYLPSAPVSSFDRRMFGHHFRVIARAEVMAARDLVARVYDVPLVNVPI